MNINGITIKDGIWRKLRHCQKEAVKTSLTYLGCNHDGKSCLLSLPTGAGKSGVIALVSHKSKKNRVLILSSRIAVRKQLYGKINGGFYQDIELADEKLDKKPIEELTFPLIDGIYCITFQKLQRLSEEELTVLRDTIDLIIVDEGHSEPSPKWSERVRSIPCHKIVVTATPYRNDLFQFDVSSEQAYIYTFSEALKDDVLMEPSFRTIEKRRLVREVSEFLRESPGTKCIVKCSSIDDIEHYYELLSKKFKVLAIHEQFAKGTDYNEDGKRKDVSVTVKSDEIPHYDIIIHQRKLDEGVDIPSAKLLVLTYTVASGRELVQTIGRVVRLYSSSPLVLEIGTEANQSMWSNYRLFDKSLAGKSNQRKFLNSLDTNKLLTNYLDTFPDVAYVGNSFKSKFSFENIGLTASLNIPLASICFIYKTNGFDVDWFLDKLYWMAEGNGELSRVVRNQCGFDGLISVTFNNSKFLKDSLFFEPSLELILFMDLGQYIALYDSRSRDLSFSNELKLGASIEVEKLLNLAACSDKSVTREAFSASVGTSEHRPESLYLKGHELEKVNISQFNSQYALSMLKVSNLKKKGLGYTKESSYYLGINTGRVSDQKNRNFSLPELSSWVKAINVVLAKRIKIKSGLINSYSLPVKELPKSQPVSLMIDFDYLESKIEIECNGQKATIEPEYLYLSFADFQSKFPWCNFNLEYNDKDKRLEFQCTHKDIEVYDVNQAELALKRFVDLLNRCPLKVLYPNGLSYLNKRFYRCLLPTERGLKVEQTRHAQSIVEIDELSNTALSEKDEKNTALNAFGANSIFSIIDQLKNRTGPFHKHISDADLLMCTDLRTEPCDFIISSPSKLVFAHVKCTKSKAKAKPRPKSAAGNIAEVGGQAIKNLEHLAADSITTYFGNNTELMNAWKIKAASQESVERVRLSNGVIQNHLYATQKERKDKVDEALGIIADRRRNYSVKKEVWIIVGNGFSKRHFINQLNKGQEAQPESLQSYQLIDSWLSTTSAFDFDLKLFCSK